MKRKISDLKVGDLVDLANDQYADKSKCPENGDIAEAESLAAVFIDALTADPRSGGL